MVQIYWRLLYAFAGAIGLGIVLFVVLRLLIRWWFRRDQKQTLHREGKRCSCGYELVGLELPRCPECGRAMGFDKTFEELGVARGEIRPRVRPPSK